MTDFGRRVALHSVTHEDAGDDEVEATGLVGRVNYVDRGDPSSYDFTLTDFTTDATWNDLDLSAIVPSDATLVHLFVSISDMLVSQFFQLREKGNTNERNISALLTLIAFIPMYADCFVKLDANRIIEYFGANITFSTINITVRGWFI